MPHEATQECACHPFVRDYVVTVHNAKDAREARERFGHPTEYGWEIVRSD
jgi:hypothetical protein